MVTPDGNAAELVADLEALPRWMWKLINGEIANMPAADLISRCERLPLRDSDGEGSWVMLRIPPVVLVGQLKTSPSATFKLDIGTGTLKIVRALPEDRAAEIIAHDLVVAREQEKRDEEEEKEEEGEGEVEED